MQRRQGVSNQLKRSNERNESLTRFVHSCLLTQLNDVNCRLLMHLAWMRTRICSTIKKRREEERTSDCHIMHNTTKTALGVFSCGWFKVVLSMTLDANYLSFVVSIIQCSVMYSLLVSGNVACQCRSVCPNCSDERLCVIYGL